MKSRSIFALALAAIAFSAAAATAQDHVQERIAKAPEPTALSAVHFNDTIVSVQAPSSVQLMLAAEEVAAQVLPAIALRRADQNEVSQAMRQRPEVTPDWRLCPST